MSNPATVDTVIALLNGHNPPPPVVVRETTDLFGEQVLDSFGILELIAALEEKIGVALPTEELTQKNFATPRAIAALVDRMRAA